MVITSSAAAAVAGEARPRFSAVDTTPLPTGLVRKRASPARAVEFRITRSGCTVPVTASPYLGSASSMECPPTIATPAAAAASEPPRRISTNGSRPRSSTEYATRLRAVSGVPPIAYTSDSALVAATRPKS